MKTGLWILGLVIVLGMFFVNGVSAQSGINDTDITNVTVTVSAVTMIDISPTLLAYTADPGEACGRHISGGTCNETGGNYYALQIENIGSWNITHAWFNVSQPTQTPFAVGADTYVDPGNWVALSTNENTNDFFFVDRKEYPAVKTIVYLTDPDGTMPANLTKYKYGRFHNGSSEYFYMIENVSNSSKGCSSAGWIRIGIDPHTQTAVGSTDFSTGPGTNYEEISLTQTSDALYAVGDITTGPLNGYAVAVENSTCAVRFCKWNRDHPFDTVDTTNAEYSYNGMLTPGDSFAKRIGIMVPYGIYTGAKTGQLTVIATGAA